MQNKLHCVILTRGAMKMLGVLTMPKNLFKKQGSGSSLVVHWLRFCASTAGAWVLFLVGELRFHIPSHSAKKQKKKNRAADFEWGGGGICIGRQRRGWRRQRSKSSLLPFLLTPLATRSSHPFLPSELLTLANSDSMDQSSCFLLSCQGLGAGAEPQRQSGMLWDHLHGKSVAYH